MPKLRILLLILLTCTFPAWGGVVDVPADVSVYFTADPSSGLVSGQQIDFTMTVTNHGPNAVSNLLLISFDFVDELSLSTATSDCEGLALVVSDGEFFHYNYWWRPTASGSLEVGETRSCHLNLALSSLSPAQWAFGFAIPFFYVDTNLDNNSASVILRRALASATPVPALSPLAMILLSGIMAIVGVVARSRRG